MIPEVWYAFPFSIICSVTRYNVVGLKETFGWKRIGMRELMIINASVRTVALCRNILTD